MPRIALDLNTAEDRRQINGEWRVAPGLVPGQENEGLVARILASPARLADYDDSGWETCPNIRESRSVGFTFAWYRITGVIVGLNAQHRVEVSGSAVPGGKHVIACLVGNGPLAEPRGGIFMRYATLAFESPG